MLSLRPVILVIFTVFSIGMVYGPMRAVLSNGLLSDYYSHILLIPWVSAYLIFAKREEIFLSPVYYPRAGLISVLGLFLFFWARGFNENLSQNDYATLITLAALAFWIGGFAFLYGFKAFIAGLFPLAFLFFMVPIPTTIMDHVIYALQVGSAEFTSLLFSVIGVPVSREGFVFQTPTVSIEIAKQCSGIRSSLGLFITGVLASHLFLRSNLNKGILIAAIYPITVFKNAVRIVTLTLLAIHVDEGFLTGGFLHKSGGFLFYLPALGIMGAILMGLRRREKSKSSIEK